MKKLLYKEFYLAIHPVCYVLVALFPLTFLIPNYPMAVATFGIIPAFPILFLGANKGKQSNDLFYSALLPIRKKDIVKARMVSVISIEIVALILIAIFYPIKLLIVKSIPQASPFTLQGIVSSFAFILVGYLIVNTIFFLMFYKSGRSITAPSIICTFAYIIYILIFTTVLPAINPVDGSPIIPGYFHAFIDIHIGIQFIYLAVALLLFIIGNIFIVKRASKELERVDL